jgi:hypothetical protein
VKLSQVRALLKKHGHKTTTEIDRFDVKRAFGKVTGVDVMLTDGTIAFLIVDEASS